jgi:hypothetical protein
MVYVISWRRSSRVHQLVSLYVTTLDINYKKEPVEREVAGHWPIYAHALVTIEG